MATNTNRNQGDYTKPQDTIQSLRQNVKNVKNIIQHSTILDKDIKQE